MSEILTRLFHSLVPVCKSRSVRSINVVQSKVEWDGISGTRSPRGQMIDLLFSNLISDLWMFGVISLILDPAFPLEYYVITYQLYALLNIHPVRGFQINDHNHITSHHITITITITITILLKSTVVWSIHVVPPTVLWPGNVAWIDPGLH